VPPSSFTTPAHSTLSPVHPPPPPFVPPRASFVPPPPLHAPFLHSPPASEGEPATKRAKNEDSGLSSLIPESEFIEKHKQLTHITVQVQLPKDDKNLKLNGSLINVDLKLTDSLATLKEKLKTIADLPPNKQNLLVSGLGFLRDQNSVAFYNFLSGVVVQLTVKERGGKKGK
jgi:splicing factor 3A subunit 1